MGARGVKIAGMRARGVKQRHSCVCVAVCVFVCARVFACVFGRIIAILSIGRHAAVGQSTEASSLVAGLELSRLGHGNQTT
jgi:hypothetical protein